MESDFMELLGHKARTKTHILGQNMVILAIVAREKVLRLGLVQPMVGGPHNNVKNFMKSFFWNFLTTVCSETRKNWPLKSISFVNIF